MSWSITGQSAFICLHKKPLIRHIDGSCLTLKVVILRVIPYTIVQCFSQIKTWLWLYRLWNFPTPSIHSVYVETNEQPFTMIRTRKSLQYCAKLIGSSEFLSIWSLHVRSWTLHHENFSDLLFSLIFVSARRFETAAMAYRVYYYELLDYGSNIYFLFITFT